MPPRGAPRRDRESRDACAELGVVVERFVALDALDQEVWSHTSEVADALTEVLPSLACDAVYTPAFQSGHPDHDGLYVVAQLARSALEGVAHPLELLRALCPRRPRASRVRLAPSGVVPRCHRSRVLRAGDRTEGARIACLHLAGPRWLGGPELARPRRRTSGSRRCPKRDAPLPHLRSYYDEVFRFDEQGIDRGTVDRVLRDALSTRLMAVDLDTLMGIALDEARAAPEHHDVPVGAVVVDIVTGELVARRHNERELLADPTAHAEILAMRDAAISKGSWRLDGYLLVVTLEPCPMCAGAAVAARISEVAFGASRSEGRGARNALQPRRRPAPQPPVRGPRRRAGRRVGDTAAGVLRRTTRVTATGRPTADWRKRGHR